MVYSIVEECINIADSIFVGYLYQGETFQSILIITLLVLPNLVLIFRRKKGYFFFFFTF